MQPLTDDERRELMADLGQVCLDTHTTRQVCLRAAEEIERLEEENSRLLEERGALAQSNAEPVGCREALEKVIRASTLPDHKATDAEFMRGSIRLANEYARIAIAALAQSDAEPRTDLEETWKR